MVKKKYQSKRLSLHKKHKIARKVREHKRSERKKERLNVHKKKKDPGIPNNWPFKEELLQQVEQARLAELESQRQAREQAKLEKRERKKLAAQARKAMPALTPLSVEMQAKKDLKESVQKSDLVLIVLDARDPQGSRSLSLEDGLIVKGNKKVVLVLNKIDLVAPDVAQKWVTYLRRFHPTIPVRSLNNPVADVKKKNKIVKGQQALYERTQGLQDLRDNGNVQTLRLFLDEASKNAEGPFHVAILGYPNVGKSTLVNSLKKRLVAQVSANPTSTKRALEIQYNDKITLIDCPALDAAYSEESAVILRHSIANIFTEDPVPAVKSLIERGDAANFMQSLQLPGFRNHEEFIARLAVKRNILRKGGDPDILLTARTFLTGLGNGSFSASCLPPAKSKSRFEAPEWFQKLDLSKLENLETLLYTSNPTDFKRALVFKAATVAHAAGDTAEYDLVMGQLPEQDGLTSEDEDDEDEEMDGDEEEEEEEMNDDEDDE
uniref:CP-type G domain-containing protein n=1 Tax=Globisporangium ultimum (strain ATCC 200006 / CBS 805.95 / DAOM BR144) TaxID=431595 RepID=K3WPD8_GLOUD